MKNRIDNSKLFFSESIKRNTPDILMQIYNPVFGPLYAMLLAYQMVIFSLTFDESD